METTKDLGKSRKTPDPVQTLLVKANNVLEVLHGQLNAEALPGFGRDMLLRDADTIVATTVAHRCLKKFQIPDPSIAQRLHRECEQRWLDFEEKLRGFSFDGVPSSSKSVLYRASALLHTWLGEFKPDPRKAEFTPGETLETLRGSVSIYQKLAHRACWTVTHDAADDFARLIYNTRWLKKAAQVHFAPLTKAQYAQLHGVFKGSKHVGFAIFRQRLMSEVFTLVYGGRFSSVEKNNGARRPIIIEPLGNMLLQRSCSGPMRTVLSSIGNDLETGQALHRERIKDPRIATVDFSDASDSNLLVLIKKLFPGSVVRYLCRYRSPFTFIRDVYHENVKLSSMGCGFTFEVMTLLLLAIARVLDPRATVYGDDVIISNDAAPKFIEVMSDIAWKVNTTKTFVDSPFRESCGSFWLDGHGYITCFDIKFMSNINDVIVTANKLLIIARGNPSRIGALFRKAYEALLLLVPLKHKGPPVTGNEPDIGHVQAEGWRRMHMQCPESRDTWARFKPAIDYLCSSLDLDPSQCCIVAVPKFVNRLASKHKRVVPAGDVCRLAHFFYSGGPVKDTIRGEGEWRTALYITAGYMRVRVNDVRGLMARDALLLASVLPYAA